MLKGKNVLVGVTGGIAAYKACGLTSSLVKAGAGVNVIMTKNAMEFVHPITFDALTHQRTVTDTFDREHSYEIEHISLADKADLLIIAPASADVIAKLANGLADDMLTTTALAFAGPKLIAPSMNTRMYENPATQRNLRQLIDDGWEIIGPDAGRLACGTTGAGKMVSPERLYEAVDHAIGHVKDLGGKHVLISAGPTQEAIDPVRFITNHSTGRMGYALARDAAGRGADVTLVSGPVALAMPAYVTLVPVVSAEEMYKEVTSRSEQADIIIMTAAVADFRPASVASEKIKKEAVGGAQASSPTGASEATAGLFLPLEETRDILAFLGSHKREGQVLCGFSMETRDLIENSRTKLEKKHLDLICANCLRTPGAGFGTDTNVLTLITRDREEALPLMTKEEAGEKILDFLMEI